MAEPTADPPAGILKAITPLIPTYAHLILTALLPIVTGAHASLTRPNNVRPPNSKLKSQPSSKPAASEPSDDENEDDDEEDSLPVETLSPRDALLFPIIAGIVLSGFYLIIKSLDDPTILSNILTYYFTLLGTFSVGKFTADSLSVLVSIIFPRRWSVVVNGKRRVYVAGHDRYKLHRSSEKFEDVPGPEEEKLNPFPHHLIPVPKALYGPLWSLRRNLLAKWAVVFNMGGRRRVKGEVTRYYFLVGDIVGLILGIICTGAYVMSGKHWIGTNIMGVSFAYGSMQIISPATFSTATLLLSLLFFYDIYFVFYTPLMETVATTLDVPIKLLFPRPGLGADALPALAMLGLGDVVLPGIMIALALRFDYWRWCEARRLDIVSSTATPSSPPTKPAIPTPKHLLPKYIKPTATWGDRLWNTGMSNLPGVFPKPYFYSSLVGYIFGMVVTLLVMHVWHRAQPALLYLVPGVLAGVWGCAVVRGEVRMAWAYTEEIEEEDEKEGATGKGGGKEGAKGKGGGKKGNKEKGGDTKEKGVKGETQKTAEKNVDEVLSGESVPEKQPLIQNNDLTPEEKEDGRDKRKSRQDHNKREEAEEEHDEDIELVDEKGEAEYVSVRIIKKPAPGAATARR